MAILKVYNKEHNFHKEISINCETSILDQMLDEKVEILFGCFGGSCASCVCEVISGGEHMNIEALKPLVYKGLKENQFLPCIAKLNPNVSDDALIEIRVLL